LAVAAAAETLVPKIGAYWILLLLNSLIITFIFTAKRIYHVIERVMKTMVGVILICFVANLVIAGPDLLAIIKGLIPSWPEAISLGIPRKIGGMVQDPMILIASLLGTTFSVSGAFFQGNLVREKGWTIKEYTRGIGDSIVGVGVLTCVSIIIMITTATVIRGMPADNIGTLAQSLRPLLGSTAHIIFCVGLLVVAMNPFLINAMIGGTMLADGIGRPAKLSDPLPRRFTTAVMLVGMVIAMLALKSGEKPVKLIIFGQALTVLGNPLMAATMLWLANRKDIMGDRRNTVVLNILGGLGLAVVVLMAARVLFLLVLKLS
jgi:Mn2+/Fe2+ NRAMP family transporter